MLLAHSGTEERLWLLAGTYPDAPTLTVTPLPEALDAAVRWMAEHAP